MSTEIELKDLTNGVNGTGVFDQLMKTMSDQLDEQFQKGRITGVSYSNVYLGSLTAIMQQSVEFLLRKDLTAKQVDLTEAQIADTEAGTALKVKQVELADTQIDLALKEIALKEAQIQITLKEVEIKEKELLRMEAEIELIEKQLIKTDSEIALLNAKVSTEQGQTSDSVNAGIVGAQRRLYEAQTQGFTNDHNYKQTKTKADIYSVMLSQDPDRDWASPPPSWVGV